MERDFVIFSRCNDVILTVRAFPRTEVRESVWSRKTQKYQLRRSLHFKILVQCPLPREWALPYGGISSAPQRLCTNYTRIRSRTLTPPRPPDGAHPKLPVVVLGPAKPVLLLSSWQTQGQDSGEGACGVLAQWTRVPSSAAGGRTSGVRPVGQLAPRQLGAQGRFLV